ncbi:nuclear transcription factor Y subunit B-4-like [Primulina tabacum]|uniref:nuclear transcription factor Y subunit B-4-like n=1 Tax=Primulina tabacum TaxID=48773 RepID=UPI003F5ACFA2
MRSVLPENAKIADDAKETVQECVSEFIDHITREANAICHRDHRKTITPEDLLYAMETAKFHEYAETLTQFLRRQREEDLARNFMRDRPLVWPNVVEDVQAQDRVLAQQDVDPGPRGGLTGPMNDDFYTPNLGEGSSSGPPMDAGVDFPYEEFDVYQTFK